LTGFTGIGKQPFVNHRILIILTLVCIGLPSLHAAEYLSSKELNSQQREMLKTGKPLLVEEESPGNPWPIFTIYQMVKASPEAVAAVFWDCEQDPKYIPNCLSARIISHPKKRVVEAEYTLKMPFFLPDEVYVSRNELMIPDHDVFEISWEVMKARYIKAGLGSIRITPMGEDSMIRYNNFVMPGSKIARIMKAHASSQVAESVNALVQKVLDEQSHDAPLLESQLSALRKALNPEEEPKCE